MIRKIFTIGIVSVGFSSVKGIIYYLNSAIVEDAASAEITQIEDPVPTRRSGVLGNPLGSRV